MTKDGSTLRVLLVAPLPPPPGGIATWCATVLKEARKHADVDMVHVDVAPRWRAVYQTQWWRRASGGGMQLVRDIIHVIWKLYRHQPEVLHLCTGAQFGLVRDAVILWIAASLNVPSVYHLHFGRMRELAERGGWEWRLIRRAIQLADQVIALDQSTLATLRERFPSKRVTQLPNCIADIGPVDAGEQCARRDVAAQTARVTYVGWICEAKGIQELIEAACSLATDWPIELELVGPVSRDYESRIRRNATALGDRFILGGEVSHAEAIEAINRADIVVLPSYTEGFPVVLLEAMALTKPIVATDVGAVRELLTGSESGDCGIVVSPRDSRSLGAAIRDLLSCGARRQELAANGRAKFLKHYNSDNIVPRLIGIWSQLAGRLHMQHRSIC